jgi:hypothetical protein
MRFMNHWDIEDAAERWRNHPVLGPATQTLRNLRNATDRNSDGWAYWPKPVRAAAKLMELIEGDGTNQYRYGNRDDATSAKLHAAYRPLKSFRTRSGLGFEIVEQHQESLFRC